MINFKNNKLKFKKYKFNKFDKLPNKNFDESVLDYDYPQKIYNFNGDTCALLNGLVLSDPEIKWIGDDSYEKKKFIFPTNVPIVKFWYFNYYDKLVSDFTPCIVCVDANGVCYYNYINEDDGLFKECVGLKFLETPVASVAKINDNDCMIFVSNTDGMYVWRPGNAGSKIDNAHKIKTMEYVYNKLFVVTFGDSRKIMYSTSLDPTNLKLDTVKSIDLGSGEINKLIVFNGSLYAFKDFEITRIGYNDIKDIYYFTNIYLGNSRIFYNTVAIMGEYIVFLTSNGLYKFDGKKCIKIFNDIDLLFRDVSNNYSKGCCSNGYYYLGCKINYADTDKIGCENYPYNNNTILKMDLMNEKIEIFRGVDVYEFSSINSLYDSIVMVYYSDSDFLKMGMLKYDNDNISSNNIKKIWKSVESDFGYLDTYKYLKNISISVDGLVTMRLYYDNLCKVYKLNGKSDYSISVFIKFKKLSIELESYSDNVKIKNLEMNIGV